MSKLLTTFQERFGDWLTALGQHLQLSLLTLLVAIFVTIPLAVCLNSHKKAANWVLQVAGIFQTIPSMALLGLFILGHPHLSYRKKVLYEPHFPADQK